jgi:predicted O-linked N-acetylglucosamine transferase (SPINDLY family)
VRHVHLRQPLDLSALTPNEWGVAFFPDIGLTVESIVLSNLRIAPIQVSCYGHPVSTFGSRIDYWLGGREIESPDGCERNYSERLVLLPGTGLVPNRPAYAPRGLHAPGETVLVNCAWTAQKANYPLLGRLRRILERSRRRIRFRFFTGGSLDCNAYLPFKRELSDLLGAANVEVFDAMPYAEYMGEIERGDFNLDSYPYGGYATATDAIYLGKPVIAWEGGKFYNRSAPSLLRRLGMQELIAANGEAYEELALRLIHDDAYRASLSARLVETDLERAIFARDDAQYVVKAFHYLVENRERLRAEGGRAPIVIGGE